MIGDIDPLDDDIKRRIRELEEATVDNGGLNFTIALNYGSRDEIVRASRKMAEDCAEGRLDPESMMRQCLSPILIPTVFRIRI